MLSHRSKHIINSQLQSPADIAGGSAAAASAPVAMDPTPAEQRAKEARLLQEKAALDTAARKVKADAKANDPVEQARLAAKEQTRLAELAGKFQRKADLERHW